MDTYIPFKTTEDKLRALLVTYKGMLEQGWYWPELGSLQSQRVIPMGLHANYCLAFWRHPSRPHHTRISMHVLPPTPGAAQPCVVELYYTEPSVDDQFTDVNEHLRVEISEEHKQYVLINNEVRDNGVDLLSLMHRLLCELAERTTLESFRQACDTLLKELNNADRALPPAEGSR